MYLVKSIITVNKQQGSRGKSFKLPSFFNDKDLTFFVCFDLLRVPRIIVVKIYMSIFMSNIL